MCLCQYQFTHSLKKKTVYCQLHMLGKSRVIESYILHRIQYFRSGGLLQTTYAGIIYILYKKKVFTKIDLFKNQQTAHNAFSHKRSLQII